MGSDRRISDEVIDELLAGARTEEEIAGPGGLLAQLTKRLVERALEVELTDASRATSRIRSRPAARGTPATGRPAKTLITEQGKVADRRCPRDRDGSFEPQIVRKRQRRFGSGSTTKILALYARGLSVREISGAPGGDLRRRRSAAT